MSQSLSRIGNAYRSARPGGGGSSPPHATTGRPEVIALSIYEAIGGSTAVPAVVDDFYDRVLGDPRLAPYFAGTEVQRIKTHQRAFIAAAIGGPDAYRGRTIAAAHSGLGISDADFDLVVSHLVATLQSLGVAAETISAIGALLSPLRSDIVTRTS
jgi:hemoglobin